MIKALMVDVDGVLVNGRPEDGKPWQTFLEDDLGLPIDRLHRAFFGPYWEDILVGRARLMDHLIPVLQEIAPHLPPEQFISYWFRKDSCLAVPLLQKLSSIRSAGIRIHLATNQEHMRAAYLMEELGLSKHVDGIYYSAQLGVKKPDQAFFSKVRSYTGFEACELLLIDDSLQNIQAAAKAGWKAVHWVDESSLNAIQLAIH